MRAGLSITDTITKQFAIVRYFFAQLLKRNVSCLSTLGAFFRFILLVWPKRINYVEYDCFNSSVKRKKFI